MKVVLESALHNDGDRNDPPYRKKLLAQRKWPILLASVVFLIWNGFVVLDGDWGPLSFSITREAKTLIIALCATSFLFGLFALTQSYAYILNLRKFHVEKYHEANIALDDTYRESISINSDRLIQLEEDLQKQEAELSVLRTDLASIKQNIAAEEELSRRAEEFQQGPTNALAQSDNPRNPFLKGVVPDAPQNAFSEFLTGVTKSAETENSLVFNTQPPTQGLNALAALNESERQDEIKKLLRQLRSSEASIASQEARISNSQTQIEQVQLEISDEENERTKLLNSNERRQKNHYNASIASELVMFAPMVSAVVYNAYVAISVMS